MKITRDMTIRKRFLIPLILVTFGSGSVLAFNEGANQALTDVKTLCDTYVPSVIMIDDKEIVCMRNKVEKGIQS